MATILSINNIYKAYGSIKALNGVSFDVPEGSVFGILGPNGSGKTTMLGIIMDVLLKDSGEYSWFGGMKHDEARRRIGCLLETPNFYHYMSAYDNLAITGALRKVPTDDRLRVLELVGLLERKDSKFQTFSLGMKQRLAIGASLLSNPKVLVLDEPTNGLDPAGIAEIRDLIRSLSKQGITIIIASHLLDEIEKVCTHVAILKRGNLLVTGKVDEVLVNEDQVEVIADDLTLLEKTLRGMTGIKKVAKSDDRLLLTADASVSTADINRYCIQQNIVLSHLALRKKSLESKFMELVGTDDKR